MSTLLSNLDDVERTAAMAAVAFLRGRLKSRDTIEWALNRHPYERVKRAAIEHLLSTDEGRTIGEPWQAAWRLVEESWESRNWLRDESIAALRAKQRVHSGDRSGSLIDLIVSTVSPQLKLEPRSTPSPAPRRPKLEDLFRASLASPHLVTFEQLGLNEVTETRFLTDLAQSLNAAVEDGLSIARRIGWDGESRLWRLGFLYRVDYVPRSGNAGGDIDEFHDGIVAAVKLLNATVAHTARLDPAIGSRFSQRWIEAGDPIHLRLWAAASRNVSVTPSDEVADTLLKLPLRPFWNLHDFPEVAELRAVRFAGFAPGKQARLLRRIRSGPPARQWPRATSAADLSRYRAYWSARELRRIEIAGATLPTAERAWLQEVLVDFPDLRDMNSLDEGFLEAGISGWVAPSPDRQYDTLHGTARLEALEAALRAARISWDNDPSERANDWIREGNNASCVLADLTENSSRADLYPLVIERFGWAHNRKSAQSEGPSEQGHEVIAFLAVVIQLSDETLEKAVNGLTFWLSTWDDLVTESPYFDELWSKLWPISVSATNAASITSDDTVLSVVGRTSDEDDRTSLDTLNTPAGRLVGLFLEACPPFQTGDPDPFATPVMSRMRNDLVSAEGRAGLIAKHRLIEGLPYFLRADESWARQHLIAPLEANDSSSLALWRAIARRSQFEFVLAHIGNQMAEKTIDPRLGRATRSSLLSSLVLEPLHAYLAGRAPVVSIARVQQALRTVEDEVRARAANMVTRFLKEVRGDAKQTQITITAADVFRKAVSPFLRTVWPQERSLATPGVSSAWAELPAAAASAFVDAVDGIENFLVPFNCWSLSDYGFWPAKDGSPSLEVIDDAEKASALLRLLDATVGSAEGATVPYDLPMGLRRISEVSPDLGSTPAFKRLSAAARVR